MCSGFRVLSPAPTHIQKDLQGWGTGPKLICLASPRGPGPSLRLTFICLCGGYLLVSWIQVTPCLPGLCFPNSSRDYLRDPHRQACGLLMPLIRVG